MVSTFNVSFREIYYLKSLYNLKIKIIVICSLGCLNRWLWGGNLLESTHLLEKRPDRMTFQVPSTQSDSPTL